MLRPLLLVAPLLLLGRNVLAADTLPVFDHALCTCGNVSGTGALNVSGHDSGGDADAQAGPIGINGVLQGGAALTTSGALHIAGATTSRVGALQVGGDLFAQGPLSCSGNGAVGGDAWLHDQTSFGGRLAVQGKTSLAPDASLRVGVGRAPNTQVADFDVQPPCNCSAGVSTFIATRIRSHARVNDNGRIGLDPNALHNVARTVRLLLPGGTYYLTSITSTDEIDLVAEGDVTLFVAGDILTPNQLHVVSARGGRLDMYVGGNVAVGANFFFGNARAPGHAHLFIAGTLHPSGVLNIAGNLYAPRADVVWSAQSRVRGSAWLHGLSHNAPLSIVHDAAVLEP